MRERWHLTKIRDKQHLGYMNGAIKARGKKVGHNLGIMTTLDARVEIRQRTGPRHRVHSSHHYNLQPHCDLSWTPFPRQFSPSHFALYRLSQHFPKVMLYELVAGHPFVPPNLG